ncbi:hypothetical protein [Bacillus cereus]|nr:hypothetical protein [Bacillus cereus]
MGESRVTYDVEFKQKTVDLYLKEGMSYKNNCEKIRYASLGFKSLGESL